MELWVWNCEPETLYIIEIMKTRYIAKYLYDIQFYLLFNMETQTPRYMNIVYDIGDRIYTYKTARERVQEQMETRALRLILNKVTGDELFSW
jgi:hypothetical protein